MELVLARVRKLWELKPHDPRASQRLAKALQVSPVVGQLLLNRGFTEPETARRFLSAELRDLYSPRLLPGLEVAVDRLMEAIHRHQKICVYGDYDVDGLTGTAILLRLLRQLRVPTAFRIPKRADDGYGLSSAALDDLAEAGVKLVVTVDCGITSCREALHARELGLDLIITDHHEPKDVLPEASVIVHPRLPGSEYPFGGISGAAVAFKLAWGLAQRMSGGERVSSDLREYLFDALSLATLGVVADVVPLTDENRILVKHGLERITKAPVVGLRALLERTRLLDTALRAEDIAFRLGPRINAAGRMNCARYVVEMLTTSDPQHAAEAANRLEEANLRRQEIERQITQMAQEMVERHRLDAQPALVLANPSWHGGVLGIVAGRLVEQYARPVLMIAEREGKAGKEEGGSGRSVPGIPLHEVLHACGEDLLRHGGHAAAAGFAVLPGRLERFRERFCAEVARYFPEGVPPPRMELEAEIPLSAVTFGLIRDIDRLEPYGAGNPRPRFLAGPVRIVQDPRRIGQGGKHLTFRVQQEGTSLRAIAWNLGDRLEELHAASDAVFLAFCPRLNAWNGNTSVEVEVVDFQVGDTVQLV